LRKRGDVIMKRVLIGIALIAVAVCGVVLAGDSGVSDPTITVTEFTTPDGLIDRTHASLDSLATAVEAVIDVADTLTITQGVFSVVNSTQLVFVASGNTNVIDNDITTQ